MVASPIVTVHVPSREHSSIGDTFESRECTKASLRQSVSGSIRRVLSRILIRKREATIRPVWALNAKAEVDAFEPAHLRMNLERRQVPFTKRLLLKLGFTPSATEFETTRLVYGYCRLHGYYVDYPHGLDERYILCPKCLASAPCEMQV